MPMTEGFDPQSLLAQALEMQQRMVQAQEEAANAIIEGSAGGGKVKVVMTGTGEVTAVRIDPSVVDPAEVDLLEDLVVAALRDAATRVAEQAEQRLSFGGLAGGLGGLGDLGALGDLFGGGGALGEADPDDDDPDDEED
jgi:DNA-binding YbaB/EbfC family protein